MVHTNTNKTEKQIVVKYGPSSSPDAQCINMISIDDTHDNTVTVYNCSALANGDCSICCALNHTRYKCTWKTNDCVYDDSSKLCEECPPPEIKLKPTDGPTHGGTRLTLTGKNFGHWDSKIHYTVHIGESQIYVNKSQEKDFDVNQPDDDFKKAFLRRIMCTVPSFSNETVKKNVTLKMNGTPSKAVEFVFKQPKVTQVIPRRGPEAGGTRITLIGENLRIGNNIVHVILNKNIKCTDVKVPFIIGKSSNITCLTGIYLDQPQNGSIYIYLDREPEASRPYQYPNEQYPAISFKYVANPKIDVVDPQIGFLSGGTSLTVTGKNLDVANKLTITSSEDSHTVSSCVIISPKEITCRVPNLSSQQKEEIEEIIKRKRRKRSASGKDCVEIPMSIKLDGYTYEFKIEYCRDPKLEKFKDGGVLVYESDDKSIKIDGQYLKLVAKDTDFKVTVGLGECKIIEVTDTQITCTPPEERSDNTEVYVEVGNIRESVGRLDYTKTVDLIGILAGVGCGVFVVVVVVVVCLCYKRNVKKQAKKYEGDLKNMEMEIIDVARQEFLDMHTTMSSVNRSLVEQGFPYHTYQQYACNVMFAVDYLWTEPVVSNSKMTDDERLRANKGMEALEKLIHNKFFLVSVISSLEKQKKFFIREKSNLAGNLCAVLMGKMDYLNEVLCLLMKNMVQDSSGKKAQQKALFRRCEKLTEKLLSNWMSLCLYPHFMSHSGSPLYLLYIALQKTIEAGPIDAETGDAKYTLSEEKLLKKISSSMSEESLKFESKSLTLNVVVNEGEEIFKCKVLDCDTISQVKSKCLSQIYVNFPASKLDVDPDELILEWHEGFGGALRLQDHDNTSSQEGSWVRLNTLAHYNVKDESNLALVDPHSAEVMQQEDYVNLTQVNMDVGGCNGSMDSTDPLTTPPETHDELQYWHLVKKEEESSKKEKSAIAELYLNRLFTTKMSLKEYIKTMFDIVLDKDHCPPPAKFLLNYLDELGEQFKVDNDTIHGWKSHSYAIRVWAALMKMPSLLFDVNIPSYMTDNLEVISQVFIDSFTLSSQKFTKDSPSQKLIFHNEMLECRERALEFYKNVKVDSQDHEELRKYLVEVNKLQQQTDFNKTSALYRFYKQTKPYLIDIVEDLATGKETKDLQLDKKLERVMQIMDEEDDDE